MPPIPLACRSVLNKVHQKEAGGQNKDGDGENGRPEGDRVRIGHAVCKKGHYDCANQTNNIPDQAHYYQRPGERGPVARDVVPPARIKGQIVSEVEPASGQHHEAGQDRHGREEQRGVVVGPHKVRAVEALEAGDGGPRGGVHAGQEEGGLVEGHVKSVLEAGEEAVVPGPRQVALRLASGGAGADAGFVRANGFLCAAETAAFSGDLGVEHAEIVGGEWALFERVDDGVAVDLFGVVCPVEGVHDETVQKISVLVDRDEVEGQNHCHYNHKESRDYSDIL